MKISKTFVKWVLYLLFGVCFWVVVGCFTFVNLFGISDRGSVRLAKKWRDELRQYETPQQAKLANSEVIVVEFQNGHWLIGFARNSHGNLRTGGTIVTKDSHGRIRYFFGHACGSRTLYSCMDDTDPAYTLEQAYQKILAADRREFFIDD